MSLNENTIRELLDASTPGPWEYEGPQFQEITTLDQDGLEQSVISLDRYTEKDLCNRPADMHLAAHAPELAADWLRMRRDLADFRAALQDGATNPELTSIDHSWCESARDGIDRILNGETE